MSDVLIAEGPLDKLLHAVEAEIVARELDNLESGSDVEIQASEFQSVMDHHDHIREHLEKIYRGEINRTLDHYNREAHISFQKNTPDEEADVAAFFLLFFNDFPH